MQISRVVDLLERVVWSGIGNASFINWKIDVTKPSVCLSGRWNNNRMESMISIAKSEYFNWAPFFFLELDLQFLIASGDSHRQIFSRFLRFCSYSAQLTPWYFEAHLGQSPWKWPWVILWISVSFMSFHTYYSQLPDNSNPNRNPCTKAFFEQLLHTRPQ